MVADPASECRQICTVDTRGAGTPGSPGNNSLVAALHMLEHFASSGDAGSPLDQRQSTVSRAGPEPFASWCLRLGMTIDAVEGWCKLCLQPSYMCCAFYFSVLCWQTVLGVMLAGKRPMTAWHVIFPHAALTSVWAVYLVRMWRMGPRSATTPLNKLLTIPHLSAMTFIGVSTCVGPDSWMPYCNRTLAVVMLAVLALFVNITGNCGAVPTLHPDEPHPSIHKPLLQSVLETGRIMDTLTDGFTIRLLVLQV